MFFFSKSFILTTLAFTWVAFALGALSWWAPKCLQYAQFLRNNMSLNETNTSDGNSVKAQYEREKESLFFCKNSYFSQQRVSLIFGIITCVAGLSGVILGSEVARRFDRENNIIIF